MALKGPITTPIGTGFRSVNVALRKELNLYGAVRPSKNLEGIRTKFDNVDLVIVRENTEDLYAGIERMVDDDTAESIKRITRSASMRIAEFAFDYAVKNNRKKVTVVTKANICKFSDGLFLECARQTAQKYPQIEFKEILIDNLCMQLVVRPHEFDVLLCPNLYGDIVSDLAAGLTGGLGIAPGANYGEDGAALFEPVHGSSPDIAGKGIANPTALIRSAVLMLNHLDYAKEAAKIDSAVNTVIKEGKFTTPDIGGNATTKEFTSAVINKLK